MRDFVTNDPDDTETWEISTRTINVLKLRNLTRWEDICRLGLTGFLNLPNCGRKTVLELESIFGKIPDHCPTCGRSKYGVGRDQYGHLPA